MMLRCACGWCCVPCYDILCFIWWNGGAGCLLLLWGLFGDKEMRKKGGGEEGSLLDCCSTESVMEYNLVPIFYQN